MKNYSLVLFGIVLFCGCAQVKPRAEPTDYYQIQAKKPLPISVTKFTSSVATNGANGHCQSWGWFSTDLGNAFQDLTVNELLHYTGVQTLERSALGEIYQNEVNLGNSDEEEKIARGHFKKAKYTLVGIVNSFEYCAESKGVSAGYSSESDTSTALVGAGLFAASKLFDGGSSATVQVTIRLIDTKTGVIVASSTGRGEQKRSSTEGYLQLKNFSVEGNDFKQSPLSDAIQDAIHQGVNQVLAKAKL